MAAVIDPDMFANLAPFAFHLFSALATSTTSSENILLSPLSIASSLAMVWAGVTKSSTADLEFQKVMGVASQKHIPNLLSLLHVQSSDSMLSMANSLWSSKSVHPLYLSDVKNYASVETTLPSTFDPINDWVSTNTHGKIPQLFEANTALDPLTVAIAVNAIHFQGSWMSSFDPKRTTPGRFRTLQNEDVTANFMTKSMMLPVADRVTELGGASVVRLDYGMETKESCEGAQCEEDHEVEAKFCALFVLPDENTQTSLQNAISGLSEIASWREVLKVQNKKSGPNSFFSKKTVSLSLPKFKLTQGPQSLKPILEKAGLSAVFQGSNQFLQMTPNDPDTHLDDVVAAATLEVTEEGTVATAATGAIMMSRSLPYRMEFNRPFIMMVMHVQTGTPLFITQLTYPDFI